ncbi:hypothetical protein ACIGO9_30395 [Nocardia asteroides]|uniref:hypothetical protein n=1 Tax=Nocardia asteroides TaxID=1824 RepID=UPI0037CA6469
MSDPNHEEPEAVGTDSLYEPALAGDIGAAATESAAPDAAASVCTCEADFVCDRELAVLGQIARLLTEATALTPALFARSMNLRELAQQLNIAREEATYAHSAASLLNSRADLAVAWYPGPSSPSGIHARHAQAVREGALQAIEDLPRLAIVPPYFHEAPPPLAQDRPQCQGITRAGKQCRNRAMYFPDDGNSADHCERHATRGEAARRKSLRALDGDHVADVVALWQRRDATELAPDVGPWPPSSGPRAASSAHLVRPIASEIMAIIPRLYNFRDDHRYRSLIPQSQIRASLTDCCAGFRVVQRAADTVVATFDPTGGPWQVECELAEIVAAEAAQGLAEFISTSPPAFQPLDDDIALFRGEGPERLVELIGALVDAIWSVLHMAWAGTDDDELKIAARRGQVGADPLCGLFSEAPQRRDKTIAELTRALDTEEGDPDIEVALPAWI